MPMVDASARSGLDDLIEGDTGLERGCHALAQDGTDGPGGDGSAKADQRQVSGIELTGRVRQL